MNGIFPDYVAGSNRQPCLSLYPDWMDVLLPFGGDTPITQKPINALYDQALEEDTIVLLIIMAFLEMKK